MKFCRDCKHAQRYPTGFIKAFGVCLHPASEYSILDIVTGESITQPRSMRAMRDWSRWVQAPLPEHERVTTGCGVEGTLFEPLVPVEP